MKKIIFLTLFIVISLAGVYAYLKPGAYEREAKATTGFPIEDIPGNLDTSFLKDWRRPDGPAKVGLQVGHWKSDEAPDELHRIRGNTGASGGGKTETEVVYEIAIQTAKLLEEKGVVVDILPATVPPKYWADVFLSIHADGSEDPAKRGYKFSGPRMDFSGKTDSLVRLLEEKYEDATGFVRDPNITRNMRGYYAFSWWRFDHAIHPMAPGVIAETGFMTNASDRKLLINNPELPAGAIADAVVEYLQKQSLL